MPRRCEFEFVGIRDPFFKADTHIPVSKQFDRGYSISIRQKLYNQLKSGMWYFGQELRFTNEGHFVNQMTQSQVAYATAQNDLVRAHYDLELARAALGFATGQRVVGSGAGVKQ